MRISDNSIFVYILTPFFVFEKYKQYIYFLNALFTLQSCKQDSRQLWPSQGWRNSSVFLVRVVGGYTVASFLSEMLLLMHVHFGPASSMSVTDLYPSCTADSLVAHEFWVFPQRYRWQKRNYLQPWLGTSLHLFWWPLLYIYTLHFMTSPKVSYFFFCD